MKKIQSKSIIAYILACILIVATINIPSISAKAASATPSYDLSSKIIYANGEELTLEESSTNNGVIYTKITYGDNIPYTIPSLVGDGDGGYDLSSWSIYGGGNKNSTTISSTSIIMNGGQVANIYGGGDSTISSTRVIMNGGFVTEYIYGGGNSGAVTSKAYVEVNGGKVGDNGLGGIFGGGNTGGTNATEVVVDSATVQSVYGAGNKGVVSKNTNVSITNSTIGNNVYGGGSNVGGNTNVYIKDSTVTLFIFGGTSGSNNYISGNTNVILDNVTAGYICASGYNGSVTKGNAYLSGSVILAYDQSYVNGICLTGTYDALVQGSIYGCLNIQDKDGNVALPDLDSFDNLLYKSDDSSWTVKGDAIIPTDVTVTVGTEETLTIAEGDSLTTKGTLTVNGTVIDDNFEISYGEGTYTDNGVVYARDGANIYADGYKLCVIKDGTFGDTITLASDDQYPMTIYGKSITGGYVVSDEIDVVFDLNAPELSEFSIPSEEDDTLGVGSANISFTSSELGTYYYIVKEGTEGVPTDFSDFATYSSERNLYVANEGVVEGEILYSDGTKDEIEITGLNDNTEYTVYFAAIDAIGNSKVFDDFISFKTLCQHDNTEVKDAVDATYDSEGYTGDTYCNDCEKTIETGTVIEKLVCQHIDTEVVGAVEATYDSEGYTGDTYCNDCEKTIEIGTVIEKLVCQHTDTEVRNAVEATYDSTGYTGDTYCKVCDRILSTGTVIDKLVKDEDDKNEDDKIEETPEVNVLYATHVQKDGWQDEVINGAMSGTSGESKRLEGITISVDTDANLGIQYTTHCQSYGWLPWSSNGDMSGTEGEAKRLEAIMIQLTGEDSDKYDVYYRVHAQSYGWLGWASNGEPAGTAGYGKRLEGIQIIVVKKDAEFNENIGDIKSVREDAYVANAGSSPVVGGESTDNLNPDIAGVLEPNISYRTHVQTYGWQAWKYNGAMSGTSGESKRLEGIEIKLTNKPFEGDIVYTTHVQSYGWQGDLEDYTTWMKNGEMSGTSGEAKRLEAICINLTGEMAENYDIYYRVHAQTYGWLDWTSNGLPAGTAGYAKRLEGIQIVIVPKGGEAPTRYYEGITSTSDKAYIEK